MTNASGFSVGRDNPFRYRGYYYDAETGFYYLNSRYYNPEWGRFISADVFVSTGQGLTGANMFAYCGNNPVMYADPSGCFFVIDDAAYVVLGIITLGAIFFGGCQMMYSTSRSGDNGLAELLVDVYNALTYTQPIIYIAEEPKTPDVTYPGDDPTKSPSDDYEWRGKPPQGGKEGGYANKNGKDSFHPDLDHTGDFGPHWDYNDGEGHQWRIFPDGRIQLKK